MLTRVVTGLIGMAILAGCNASPLPPKSEEAGVGEPKVKPIDGYEDIKFGQGFNEVMAAHGGVFDPYYVRSCYKNLAINGCSLSTPRDGPPFQMIDGIPYRLTVRFNKFDKVTDIQLQYIREGSGINGDDCRSIHERTLDWLTRDYGKFYSPNYDLKGAKLSRTPAGNTYFTGPQDESGSWVSIFARTYAGVPSPEVLKKPLTKWDGRRYAESFTTFIVASGNHCEVQAEFSEPESVPREDLMRAADLVFEDSAETSSSADSEDTEASISDSNIYDGNGSDE